MSLFGGFAQGPQHVARLVADRGLHGADGATEQFARGRLIAPGLRQVMVEVRGKSVSGPLDPAVHGGWEVCAQRAVEGLARLPAPRHSTLRVGADARIETYVSDDVFGASRLLVLDGLLAATLRIERPEHGVLVIAPNRHLLAVHVLERIEAVPAALQLLGELAVVEHRIADPVSPWVYYRAPDTRLSLLTASDGGAGLARRFGEALTRMAGPTG
ncbi:MAG: hypothetical protein L6367_10620 [Cellulomonas sp.]|nr:hypothetical protein [Actinomycetota bacterium]MCG2798979.1 hypothetical protein [Cellulomonas sp.]